MIYWNYSEQKKVFKILKVIDFFWKMYRKIIFLHLNIIQII